MDDVHQVDDQKGGERRKEDAMKSTSLIMTLILGMSGFVGAGTFSMKFKKAELKNQFGSIAPGAKGELIVDSEKIRFEEENGKWPLQDSNLFRHEYFLHSSFSA